jgi:hypothetical protein
MVTDGIEGIEGTRGGSETRGEEVYPTTGGSEDAS